MRDKNSTDTKRPFGAERPFPWHCRHCGQDQVFMTTLEYNAEVRRDGRLHAVKVANLEIPVCRACGQKVFTEKVDAQIDAALRSQSSAPPPNPVVSPLRVPTA